MVQGDGSSELAATKDRPAGRGLVSACLTGLLCRHDGGSCPDDAVMGLVAAGRAIPVCPEQLGGLPTPRSPAEIRGGDGRDVLEGRARVVNKEGKDLTEVFLRGAHQTLRLARLCGAKWCLLKERSPSCGVKCIYDGTFSGRLRPGVGVAAALLREGGIDIIPADG